MVVSSGQEVDKKKKVQKEGGKEREREGERKRGEEKTEERKHEKNVFETHANVSIRFWNDRGEPRAN